MSIQYSRNWRFINSPKDLPNLAAWYRYNTDITVTGSGVSQWDDQTGKGHHLLQGSDTNRPSKESEGSILFDGVDNYLQTATFSLVQPTTVYLLVQQLSWISFNRIFDGNGTNSVIVNQNPVSPSLRMFAQFGVNDNADLPLNTYGVVSVIYNGADSSLQVNSNAKNTDDAGPRGMNGLTLGSNKEGNNLFSNIQVKEVIIYDIAAHTDKQRTQVITYLNRVNTGVFPFEFSSEFSDEFS